MSSIRSFSYPEIWSVCESILNGKSQTAEARKLGGQLLAALRNIETAILNYMPLVREYLDSLPAASEVNWDSEPLESLAGAVMEDFDNVDKQYVYRPTNRGTWEVRGVYMNGEEEWLGDVETECLAESLIQPRCPSFQKVLNR